jgi:two-component system, chemotaxis family, chemotaxis protein CheY
MLTSHGEVSPGASAETSIGSAAGEVAKACGRARCKAMTAKLSKKDVADRIQGLCVLVVDDNQYMRKMIRNLLVNCGVKDIYEAGDGIAALDTIRTVGPDVVILDWEMPMLSGAELVRIVRSPGVFPMPDIPIIMLSAHGERWRVVEAVKLGVNEYLVKPVSAKSLYDRLVSITIDPRPSVQLGDYYGPEPRKLANDQLDNAPDLDGALVDAVVN